VDSGVLVLFVIIQSTIDRPPPPSEQPGDLLFYAADDLIIK